jgi:hypothetical protein
MVHPKCVRGLLLAACLASVSCRDSDSVTADRTGLSDDATGETDDASGTSEDARGNDAGAQTGSNADCDKFDSTFAAIQSSIFERHGCTAETCHGGENAGMLDLRPEVAYANLFGADSSGSSFRRVEPGTPSQSFLYLKLMAATQPDRIPVGIHVEGSPMPVGAAPLSADELDALRIWITQGAPDKGSVGDPQFLNGSADHVNKLLGVCLPPSAPVDATPLPAPDEDKGIQLVMPPYVIDAHSEKEICFASYYDFTARVPERFMSPDKKHMHVNGLQMRQDAVSHHLVAINTPDLDPDDVRDPSFGTWTCKGGARDGEACDPLELTGCGDGLCSREEQLSPNCSGFGPVEGRPPVVGLTGGLATALSTQVVLKPLDGVYREIPIKGIVFWNAHAFNLTDEPHTTHAWLNLDYTDDLRFREQRTPAGELGPTGIAAFTKKDVCKTHTFPQGTKLLRMTSHTHKHGKYFWITNSKGEKIYEAHSYSDPTYTIFDPPMIFDAPDRAQRTVTYCATFNNGVDEHGLPDSDLVARSSRFPVGTAGGQAATMSRPCVANACASGKVGAPCKGTDDSAACDSSPGAGDGLCDACATLGGQTTEHEMFFMVPDVILPEGASVDTGASGTIQCGILTCSGTELMGMSASPCCPADTTDTCGLEPMAGFCLSSDPGTPDPACPSQSGMGLTVKGCCTASGICGVDFASLPFGGLSGCNDPGALGALFGMSMGMTSGPPVTCGK